MEIKAIKVTEANLPKIDAAISKAEGRCTARTADSRAVLAAIRIAEARLGAILPKKYWDGARGKYNADVVPNAYAHAAYGTYVTIERRGAAWYLVAVSRDYVRSARYGRNSGRGDLRLTLPALNEVRTPYGVKAGTLSRIGTHLGIAFDLNSAPEK